ncbi:lactate utilization protein [Breznakiella homolactica]|uniref:Lactate utilization protein n=1 Tax=Breznakiella homolactica TaxID=2798577 RepID=A0A7T7XPK5_9SPIR|nr:lactate utilization protein [Breznakiella homolactica]QQO10155.1 lactate utilization protein [Breznakiella homolactica]
MDTVESVLTNLRKNRIPGKCFKTSRELFGYLGSFLFPGCTAGAGDSVTLEQLGVYDYLRSGNCVFLDKYTEGITKNEKRALYLANFSADFFFSGINALSQTGKIFNLDGNGSRAAPIIYGPKKVFLLCGTNKIVPDDEAAVLRVRNTAAPMDARRLGRKTPCAKTGRCMDCAGPERICNYMTVIQGQFDENRIEVLIVEQDLGY